MEEAQEALKEHRDSGSCGNIRQASVTTSPSGSYNTDDIMAYLRKILLPWGPGRKWRILLVDAFSAHLDETVARLAWDCGYLIVYIGGGCTGAIQVLDTHLHGPLSRCFQEMEMSALLKVADEDPAGLPRLDRGYLMSILLAIWQRSLMHVHASIGFRHNMFSLSLDGTEDMCGSEECREYWSELKMNLRRAEAMEDVKAAVDAGDLPLTFESYRTLLEPFPARGHLDVLADGQDDEGFTVDEDKAESRPWDDGAGQVVSPACSDVEDEAKYPVVAGDEEQEPCADKEVCRQVHLYVEDLHRYDRMEEEAIYGADHSILRAVERARRAVTQKMEGKGAEDALIADAMLRIRDSEDAERTRKRAETQRRKAEVKRLKDAHSVIAEERTRMAEQRARLRLQAEAQQREQETLDAARAFDAKDFADNVGQRTQASKNRWVAMQRVLLLSKALPPASISTLSRDWAKWDSCNRNSTLLYPTPDAYAIRYKNWLQELLAHLSAGNSHLVAQWWHKEVQMKVPKPDVQLPPLPPSLLLQATHLAGEAPASAACSGGGGKEPFFCPLCAGGCTYVLRKPPTPPRFL